MARGKRTTMGGADENFEATHWSEIIRVRTDDAEQRRQLLADVLGRYWKPVYCYLRRKGYANEPAKDLVQGFFQEVVLARGLIERADPERGKFRTFLLTALDRYATSVHRRETARKRRPVDGVVSLDGLEGPVAEPSMDATPEQAFHHAWASALLQQVLETVEQLCHENGQDAHWAVFCARVVKPTMENAEAPSLRQLCEELGISDEVRASNMIVTTKRRFQHVLKRQVRQFVASDAEVDGEIRSLIEILSKK